MRRITILAIALLLADRTRRSGTGPGHRHLRAGRRARRAVVHQQQGPRGVARHRLREHVLPGRFRVSRHQGAQRRHPVARTRESQRHQARPARGLQPVHHRQDVRGPQGARARQPLAGCLAGARAHRDGAVRSPRRADAARGVRAGLHQRHLRRPVHDHRGTRLAVPHPHRQRRWRALRVQVRRRVARRGPRRRHRRLRAAVRGAHAREAGAADAVRAAARSVHGRPRMRLARRGASGSSRWSTCTSCWPTWPSRRSPPTTTACSASGA